MPERSVPRALTIAGSDSGGGAGIQADLKTFAAFGVYGASVLTAVTAQNTLGVTAVQDIDVDVIAAQIDAVATDIAPAAVKTGMLSSAAIILTVAEGMRRHRLTANLVVDPVMVAASGDRLLREDAVATLKAELLPLALVATPNAPEAEALSGLAIASRADMEDAARRIHALGPKYVIVKGGHLSGTDATDVLYDGRTFREFSAPRLDSRNTHGTGCTFSSAIAAGLARGRGVGESVELAKAYVTEAMRRGFAVGRGAGPLNHLYAWWEAGGKEGRGG